MSSHDNADRQSESVTDAVTAMKLEHGGDSPSPAVNGTGAVKKEDEETEQVLPPNGSNPAITTTSSAAKSRSQSRSPVKKEEDEDQKGENANDDEEKVGGDITVRLEPGQPPKLARSTSQKVVPRPPPLFLDLPDSTEEARSSFEVMETCTYANKYMGYTEHAMECDCAEEWGKLFFFLSLPPFFLFFLDLRLLFYSFYFVGAHTRVIKSSYLVSFSFYCHILVAKFCLYFHHLTMTPRFCDWQKSGMW